MKKLGSAAKSARTNSAKVAKSQRGTVVKQATSLVRANAQINFKRSVRK